MQTDQERAALKHELKSWESTFFAHHGRRPIQADIAADPIAKSYRKYEMLKKKSSTMTATASKTSSMLQRSKSISKGSGSEQHLDRIRKGFSFLNHTIPIPCNNVPATTSSNQTHAISAAHSSADPKSSSTMDENTNPSLSRSSTDPAAKIRFRRTSALPRTESFISPLNGLSRTASNINLPLSDDDDHVHEMANSSVQQQQTAEPSLQLGELAEKFMSAADAELFVPETSGSDLVHSVLVPLPESQMKPKLRRLSDRPTTTTDRVSLTNNFVKYDLKHDWRSKNKPARKSSWKSAKMYAIELKKKRIDERNSALYTDLLDDGLRLIQIQNKESHAGSESDNHPDERDHDFKRRRVDVPKTKTSPTPQVNLEASSEFNRDLALMVLNNVFGFQSFRINQFEVIDRIMHHQSTFAVLPTGAGKSLLYQMPAYLLPGICLVITPLLSLMKDQLSHLPSSIPGAIWSSNETVSQVQDLIMRLRANQIKVLFLSPERLQTQGFQRTIQSLPPPGVSFACIDEVHCVSQWSHNFRPAFVRVGNILRNHLAVQCILALTATATKHTLNSVCSTLMMNPDDIIMADVRRDNLFLSVSREHDRFSALVTLLNSDRFRDLSSIIIYVHQQRTADKVMFRLRTQGIDAVSYHAGKDAKTRRAIQEQFMSNKARIICATIAFGMGLDKHDVRAIIHFNCPQSMEHYVQEIGRAGRDGMPAFCHVFYDEDDVDRFRSLAFSNGVDGDQVIKFLRSIFDGNDGYGERYLVALSCTKQVQAYDLREEVVETFLTFLEFETGIRYIHALPMLHKTCTIRFLRTSEQQLAKADPILSEILSQSRSYSGSLSVNIVNIANSLHVPLADVHRTILTLKSLGEISAVWKDLCFCIEVLKRPDDLDALCADLINFCRGYESCKHRKVNIISQILKSVATERCLDTHPDCQSRLQQMISTYFICDSDEQLITEAEALLPDYERLESLCDKRPRPDHLIGDIKVLLLQWKDKLSTARQVARILHGISSPKFPYKEWCKYPAWGKYVSYPFENVLADATMVLESLH